MSLATTCSRCGIVIPYGKSRCNTCEESYKYEYDNRRDTYSKTFYSSKKWQYLVEQVKIKYKYLDIYEYYINNKIVYGDISHHVEELRENKKRNLDITNLIYLTTANHNKIHALYNKNRESKLATQQLLFNLIQKWNDDSRV